jgi:hypothetical protein
MNLMGLILLKLLVLNFLQKIVQAAQVLVPAHLLVRAAVQAVQVHHRFHQQVQAV